jgi:hypothetical protein
MTRPSTTPLGIALLTTGYLFGGFAAGIAIGFVVGSPTPGAFHMTRNVAAGVIAVACMMAASTLWARELARRAGVFEARRAAWAGALSFGPVAIVVGLVLTALEQQIVERGRGPALPIHTLYGILFVSATLIVASVTTWIVAAGLGVSPSLQHRVALSSGFAAAGAYFLVYLGMEFAGWEVGAPGAAQRATMLVVTGLGALAAALAGGATLGAMMFSGAPSQQAARSQASTAHSARQ